MGWNGYYPTLQRVKHFTGSPLTLHHPILPAYVRRPISTWDEGYKLLRCVHTSLYNFMSVYYCSRSVQSGSTTGQCNSWYHLYRSLELLLLRQVGKQLLGHGQPARYERHPAGEGYDYRTYRCVRGSKTTIKFVYLSFIKNNSQVLQGSSSTTHGFQYLNKAAVPCTIWGPHVAGTAYVRIWEHVDKP